ncbi:methylase [Thioalkalivibrio paradoxus ARh 1]|uniref:Methylase n=2 Tax=Thioalkalivibrio paradoxus TaxID=108010 RepID=W0DKY7_9GAMM|nr:methylase [Thioalkalivibrio paradoxus ARh 1]
MQRPFAESAEQNKGPILEVLREWFGAPGNVLEIGSGTGQHAVHFAAALPHLEWQPSDVAAHLGGIEAWRAAAGLANLRPARALDVATGPWPDEVFDYAYTANTAHIMHWREVLAMLAGVAQVLRGGGVFAMYGPFSVDGRQTAASNAAFDAALRRSDPGMGVRDLADLRNAAQRCELELVGQVAMPVNNLTLIWRRQR